MDGMIYNTTGMLGGAVIALIEVSMMMILIIIADFNKDKKR